MDLRAGQHIGPFEILGPLGAGGMGEVHHARDTRLGREVALKVLPGLLNLDAARVARFDREARLLAALNHPHIGAIYGVEDSAAGRLLVLELVPGETLADRIARGPLPMREALSIARDIAGAVAFAHGSGVVHRDLKPANVKCTPNGVVKVLDFGLAKALSPDSGVFGSDHPTVTPGETRDGVLLGTPTYMSPEQARGQEVDRRTDVWSFGCILYEMLTARRLFQRATIADTLSAVLNSEPDWSALPKETPPAIRTLLRRCLQRDRDRRLHDMADARLELDEAIDAPASAAASAIPPPTLRARIPEFVAVAVIVLTVIASAALRQQFIIHATGLYEAVALELPFPLRLYLGTSDLAVKLLAILVALRIVFAILGRPWSAAARRRFFGAWATIAVLSLIGGLYAVAETSLVQTMRYSIGWRTHVVERDLVSLYLAGGQPARAIALIDPKGAPEHFAQRVAWGTPGLAFHLAEAYRAQGDLDAARRLYRQAQAAAQAFDEELSHEAVIAQERWESTFGIRFADWGLPVAELRKLPDLIRDVAQKRLDAMDAPRAQ